MKDATKQLILEDLHSDLKNIWPQKMQAVDYLLNRLHTNLAPLHGMMADYECAAMEVETKFKVLNKRLSIDGETNPIETIKVRIKEPESIIRKLEKLGVPLTLESVEKNLFDVAGVRVICSLVSDIYRIEKLLLAQDDVTLHTRKDYIENPKPSGYRSLHLIIQTPIFTENGKKDVFVEVQLRTIAMDFWASLEHKLRYKKDIDPDTLNELAAELESCAAESARLDERMQQVKDRLASDAVVTS